jgi:small-conductance mechanosensitive channel
MNYNQIIEDIGKMFAQLKQSIIELLPNLLGAVAVFLVGFLAAFLLRALMRRFLKRIGSLIPHKKIQSRLHSANMEGPASVISNIFYWIVIFFFLATATEILGLPVVTTWLSGIAGYLPKILVAVFIGLAGFIGGGLLRDVVATTATSAGIMYGDILGRLAQYAILLMTLLIGIEQVGINITFLTNAIIVLIAAMLFGAALAFGLGARTSVSNILASFYLQKTYQAGNEVKIGGVEGLIVQITPVAVILETSQGQVYLPAKKFNEMASTLLRKDK